MKRVFKKTTALTRRQFLVASAVVAGGLSLQLRPGNALAAGQTAAVGELSPWLTIHPDDSVVVTTAFAGRN